MSRPLARIGLAAACAVLLIFLLFPFYYAVVTSLKSGSAIFRVDYWPAEIDLSNYVRVWREQPFARNILNSVIVAGGVVAISLALAVSAAFALGRVRFAGRSWMGRARSCWSPASSCRCWGRRW